MRDKPRTATGPEIRLAQGAWANARQDLLKEPFALRPLPPLGAARVAALGRYLPGWLGKHLGRLPHLLLSALAAAVFLGSLSNTADGGSLRSVFALLFSLLATAPLALVLFRPVGAYWVSLAGVVVGLTAGHVDDMGRPWTTLALVCHTGVMALVVLRTRPRVAPETWLVTLAVTAVMTVLTSGTDGELAAMAGASALFLTVAAAVRAWRDERRNAERTETVTERERSRRTLLEERATIARELHDVVAHHMSVIAIQAEAAPYRVEETPPELATALSTIRENAVVGLTELRRILGVVRADDPEGFAEGSPDAPQPTLAELDALLDTLRDAGLEVLRVTTGAVRTLPQGVELSAYRIVQEALSNALRHAPGASAQVEISYVLGGLGLRIVNDRPSRLAKPSPGAGHGVLGMRERVQVLGGEISAEPTEDGGFEVAVFLPCSPGAEPARRAAAPAPAGTSEAAEDSGGHTA
ncbi:histidine kinase [Streptomyces sp. HNM0574]|uniref:sensor histidine kinase n=1 Tax=Streptomyces sp. HNM0574 TaxID=2714954 RepID=UPI00146D9756|nr:histidine kinase [Streptomyces sp. HNM0574]NLU69426.1 two-component sensor histidine kinase [Streptomyces sp. HNM0574]